jgi:hypothetical protein
MSGAYLTPDSPLTLEQQAVVDQLSESEIRAIDEALLSNALPRWRKVAMIVGLTMSTRPNPRSNIPDVFYAQRVRSLVSDGRLESQGNLAYMGFSEVRLPQK